MAIEPQRRSYTEERSSLRDVDGARRARIFKAFAWAAFPGVFLGLALSMMMGLVGGMLTGLAIALFVAGFGLFWSEGIGSATNRMLHPNAGKLAIGNSRADALLAQGDFAAAAEAWEITASEHPSEPGPPARVARIYRDHLNDLETAVRWFRKAVELERFSNGVTMRELVEAARKADGVGSAAAPFLARYREATEGTPEGEWSAKELAWIKQAMQDRG